IYESFCGPTGYLCQASGSGLPVGDQSLLIKLAFSWMASAILLEIILGPLFYAFAVYVGRARSAGQPTRFYEGLNFALNRYRRQFFPHAGAQLSIQLGMIVIIPGILFQLQYAFVDAVACLEDEKWPMARSTRLTRGRRRTLFFIFLPFLLLSQVRLFPDMQAVAHGTWALAASHGVWYLLVFSMLIAFYLVYEERTTPHKSDSGSPAAGSNP
ncbi:MAG: hypothetical protein QGG40_01635, partial [Myxococcota bacterium]|nr:hypothetical protein [Myxococcota bacterium]